ncbi:MAG: histidine phosphatase family protein [Campylobacteraceae bacterium]|jgi:phosphohistidine phosphatase|nr:histidine phosphatase family protein [Campylobacteraceae bacterium]
MKTIYFIRHAKSDWSVDCDDFDRGLNQRGLKDAPFMAERLKKHGVKPDIIISSPAKRAFTTATIIAKTLGVTNLITEQRLYDDDAYLKIVQNIDDRYKSVFIVAHNPLITKICESLSKEQIDNIPTCGIFCIEFNTDFFSEISLNNAKKLFFDFPKKHKF